ncbi:MAG: hypothetical protein NT030_00860 [Candidatus Saganbacteria bacterium]|nr:hypothetical protein [Candidatus Saganbacteria bacterium]
MFEFETPLTRGEVAVILSKTEFIKEKLALIFNPEKTVASK